MKHFLQIKRSSYTEINESYRNKVKNKYKALFNLVKIITLERFIKTIQAKGSMIYSMQNKHFEYFNANIK